jgi:hypothetical protein
MPMDLMIATGVFALVLAMMLVLVTGRRDDSARAANLLVDATRPETDAVGEGLMRTGGRPRRPPATNRREELLEIFYRALLLHRLEESM